MRTAISVAMVVVSALALYLAAPRQQLLGKPIPASGGVGLAAVLLVAACWLRGDDVATHTHFFIVLTLLLLAWGLIPYAVAWIRQRGGH